MAQTIIKNEYSLKLNLAFVDGDTRTLTLKNPQPTIESSEISELNQYIQTNNLLIGDKTGATFGRIKDVSKVTTHKEEITF